MSGTPLACNVAAAATMMNTAMIWETVMPTMVSVRMRASSVPAVIQRWHSRGSTSVSCKRARMSLLM